MAHLSNSTDYYVFIANMERVMVNPTSVEMLHSDFESCSSCSSCKFNGTLLCCEYDKDCNSEIYHKLLHYISIYHPEKLV